MSTETTNTDFDIWLEEFLTGLLDRTGLDVWVSEMDIDENTQTYTVQLDGDDKARAIGREGQMLNSLQHLAISAAANRGVHEVRIVIDVDGYRNRRDSKLIEDAEYLANEAISTGEPIEMEPMCARDRRLVHMIVSKMDGVKSESFGQGRDRFVRLIPRR
ncbi:MAG: KH domain-containing protein [Deltaproteobacteria bacterium]|nr:KH domain-containing protein [Deltaproteobacteria bacterium]MBN2674062.1 KH domain-containing protein [Deltaproteobacteria bacterium]